MTKKRTWEKGPRPTPARGWQPGEQGLTRTTEATEGRNAPVEPLRPALGPSRVRDCDEFEGETRGARHTTVRSPRGARTRGLRKRWGGEESADDGHGRVLRRVRARGRGRALFMNPQRFEEARRALRRVARRDEGAVGRHRRVRRRKTQGTSARRTPPRRPSPRAPMRRAAGKASVEVVGRGEWGAVAAGPG